MNEKNNFSPRRALWKLVCLCLGLLLVLMLSITAGFRYLTEQIRFSDSGPDPVISPTLQEATLEYLDPRNVNWTQLSADVTKKDKDIINLLLIGQDRREGEHASRADSILLCSFRKEDGTMILTSFLRDLYLPIPGHESDRLNAAYAYGGTELMKKTLTENFQIPIDGCLEVDFSRFAQIIDTLGGVTLELRQDEAEVINRETGSSLTDGSHLLTGQQALVYSRIRKLDSDGDFSRTDRQRKVVSAVVGAYRNSGLSTLMKLLKQVLPMISTDMTESRLLLLALDVFPMLPSLQITSQSIPEPGTFTDKTINGMAVLWPDMDAARARLQETAGRQ